MGLNTAIDLTRIGQQVKENYQIVENTFSKTVLSDARNLLTVEVGDAKQADFYPQVKLQRWDNEVNFSARLIDENLGVPIVGTLNDAITWKTDKREIRFYELPASEILPEGGYEFEVILNEAPASNVVAFTLQTKGLEFLYQGPLSKSDVLKGHNRPEGVVGSYAVYYKDCPENIAGGKLYKNGKAFHIYRPRIEDATGAWVYGVLNIDEVKGLLTVTIPESFLKKAVYPVKHAAGLTLGYSSIGASSTIFGGPGIFAQKGTAAAGGVVNSISAHYRSAYGMTVEVRAAIYLLSTLAPLSPQSGAISTSSTTYSWKDFTITSGPTITATNYYVALIDNGNLYEIKMDTGGVSGSDTWDQSGITYPTWPNPLVPEGYDTLRLSLYCTYTPSGPASVSNRNGLALSSISNIKGLAVSSILNINGLA